MLARMGGRPAWDSVWAEDPGIYLPAALAHPWHLLQSYGGYLQLVPRLIGQIAALLPIRYASVAFAVSGALIASACGLFAYHASAGHVSSRWLRALLGLSVVLLPVAQLEIADNGVNSIWYLLYALFWGSAVATAHQGRRGRRRGRGVRRGSLKLARPPVRAAVRGPRDRGAPAPPRARRDRRWAFGCLLQVLAILTSHLSRLLRPRDPVNAVLYYVHEVLLPALGWHLSWHLRDVVGLTGATALAGGFIVIVLAFVLVTQPGRCRVFVVAAVATGLLFTAVTTALAWGGPGQRVTIRVEHGARYSTVPILLLDAALIVAADAYARRWWPRPRAIAAVAALIAVLAALGHRLPLPGPPPLRTRHRLGTDGRPVAWLLPAQPGRDDHRRLP